MLTQARAKELVDYDPETGIFTWVKSTGCRAAGSRAGTVMPVTETGGGYRKICLDKEQFLEHRLAFLWMTGEWPLGEVDHDNNVHDDNRWGNLRPAEPVQNMLNRHKHKNNTSGVKGVSWNKFAAKWVASISYLGKQRHLGYFDDLADAKEFTELVRDMCHGEFACHGA